jgi:hypothetical protein
VERLGKHVPAARDTRMNGVLHGPFLGIIRKTSGATK